jgi:hypothetical protein
MTKPQHARCLPVSVPSSKLMTSRGKGGGPLLALMLRRERAKLINPDKIYRAPRHGALVAQRALARADADQRRPRGR